MGHVMRCLSLVRELERLSALTPVFVMRGFAAGVRWVERHAYDVAELPSNLSLEDEAVRVRVLIEARHAKGVITDLRRLPSGFLEAIQAAGAVSVVIDEWGRQAIRADLLTNGTIVPGWHHYELEGTVRCCLGPRFALLEPQFAALHDQPRPPRTGSQRILIALGGDDPFFLTVKIMRAVERLSRPLEVMTVIGPAFTNGEEIRRIAGASRHWSTVREGVSNMAELLVESDVALTGGGLIALEMACVGTPGFIVCEVSHQLETAAVLEQHGAAVNVWFGVAASEEDIARDVAALLGDEDRRRRMSEAGKRLIDGKGCLRVAQAILEVLAVRGGMDEQQTASVPVGR